MKLKNKDSYNSWKETIKTPDEKKCMYFAEMWADCIENKIDSGMTFMEAMEGEEAPSMSDTIRVMAIWVLQVVWEYGNDLRTWHHNILEDEWQVRYSRKQV